MYYAGLLVRVAPDTWEEALELLRAIPSVELHQQERETGRVVVTVESPELDRQTTILDEIRALEPVLLAEPVYAYMSPPESPETP